MFIEMRVDGITLDPVTNMPIVILKDLKGDNALPIWIGIAEASAIATQLEKIDLARPMTHDLIRNILDELDVTLEKIEVTDLKDNTFFANIYLRVGKKVLPVDHLVFAVVPLNLTDAYQVARQFQRALPRPSPKRRIFKRAN